MAWYDDFLSMFDSADAGNAAVQAGSDAFYGLGASDLFPGMDTASGAADFWGQPALDLSGLLQDNYQPNFSSAIGATSSPAMSQGSSLQDMFSGYTPTMAEAPSAWDTFNNGLQKVGNFTGSKGGQLLMGGIGGLASYLDAKKKNALMKQMMEQAAAEKAAKAAKAALYDSPARVTNTKTAAPSWGAGTQAFSGNSLRAMTPRSTNTMYAAEGGPVPKKTGVLDFIRFLATGEADKQTPAQREAAKLEAERRARMTPSELQAEKINNAYDDGRLQKTTDRARGGFIAGGTSGQSDKVPAMLSDGEFVMDADTVSALGDGNNAAGASALEKMRQNVRAHKRAAPVHKIPPKAKKPEAYLKGAK